jgi:hypothetical protein
MQPEQLVEQLPQRSVLLVGGAVEERQQLAEQAATLLRRRGAEVYEFPPGLRAFDAYLKKARHLLPVRGPGGRPAHELTVDQLSDVHLDWTRPDVLTLLVLPEVDGFHKRDRLRFIELLSDFLTRSIALEQARRGGAFRLLATAKKPLAGIPDELRIIVGHRDLPIDWQSAEAPGDLLRRQLLLIHLA